MKRLVKARKNPRAASPAKTGAFYSHETLIRTGRRWKDPDKAIHKQRSQTPFRYRFYKTTLPTVAQGALENPRKAKAGPAFTATGQQVVPF